MIKVLCTTVGETAADLLNEKAGRRPGRRAHGPGLLALRRALRAGHRGGAVTRFALGLDAVWSFWIAYVLTRPLGASVGDRLSQPTGDGGLSLSTVVTSTLFLTVVLGLVVFLAITRKDVTKPNEQELQAA